MKLLILNGPNLNLLGSREPDIYGSETFLDFFKRLDEKYSDHDMTYIQSNIEGDLIDHLHQSDNRFDAVIFNPGGYSHTSVALSDAIAAIQTPVVEVHISNIYAREAYRHQSLTGKNCVGVITGFGLAGYDLAVTYVVEELVRSSK